MAVSSEGTNTVANDSLRTAANGRLLGEEAGYCMRAEAAGCQLSGVCWVDGDADTRHLAREVSTDDDDSPRKVPVVSREEKHQVLLPHH